MRTKITAGACFVAGVAGVLSAAPHMPVSTLALAVGVNLTVTAPVLWTLGKWRRDRADLVRLFELLVEEMANHPREGDLERR